jgi:parallel beta-helix repeat protein
MRKTVTTSFLVFVFLTASLAVSVLPAKAEPKTITVPDDYPTVQAAVGNASAGDTVFVKEGIYNSSIFGYDGIFIDKPISLIGQDSQRTVISRPYYKYSDNVIRIAADDVTISGLTITSSHLIGIRIESSSGSNIQPSGIRIIGNNILGQNAGVITYGGEDYVISQNNITGNDQGLSFSSSNSIISDNNIAENGMYGLSIGACQSVTVKGNNIRSNGFYTNPGMPSSNSVPDQGGLSLGGSGIHVYENNITENAIGIQFYLSNNSVVSNNNILGNQVGVNLENVMLFVPNHDLGSGNKIHNNNLIGNDKNAFVWHSHRYWNVTAYNETYGEGRVTVNGTTAVSWDNGYVGNYWSDYTGQGTYVIDESNVDHYPLTRQVDVSAPAPTLLTIAIVAVAVAVGAGLLVYYRKRRRETAKP